MTMTMYTLLLSETDLFSRLLDESGDPVDDIITVAVAGGPILIDTCTPRLLTNADFEAVIRLCEDGHSLWVEQLVSKGSEIITIGDRIARTGFLVEDWCVEKTWTE